MSITLNPYSTGLFTIPDVGWVDVRKPNISVGVSCPHHMSLI
ncbi:MAG: hypothetical protein V7K48_03395 [Nostoc sp.]